MWPGQRRTAGVGALGWRFVILKSINIDCVALKSIVIFFIYFKPKSCWQVFLVCVLFNKPQTTF